MVLGPHYCYIIYNDKGNTYTGYSNNLNKRIRQHNGELVGGAKSTHNSNQWKYLIIFELLDFSYRQSLQYEYALKHPTNKRKRPHIYNGKEGRINSIPLVLSNPKFENLSVKIDVIPEYYESLVDKCKNFENVTVRIIISATDKCVNLT